ncbi:MAG TPA: biotin/lipoyl-containing protein, partial [Candidatus Dormibacteraeota bacterium]
MTETVIMPQLGESVTEGTIARWLKQPGEPVERYEAIAEVVTDKVNAEIPSPSEGTMGQHLVEEGAVVPVGAPICNIEAADAATSGTNAPVAQAVAAPELAAPAPAAPGPAPLVAEGGVAGRVAASSRAEPTPGPPPPPAAAPARAPEPAPVASAPPGLVEAAPAVAGGEGNGHGATPVTPAVRMLAREHSIDL